MRTLISFHRHHTRIVAVLLGQAAVIGILSSLLYLFGPNYLPLWYSLVEPSEQLAPRISIFAIPAVAGAITLLTLWYGRRTQLDHEEYLASISLWGGNILLFLLEIALLRIMKVVL